MASRSKAIRSAAAADLLANGKIIWPYLGIQGEATAEGQSVVEVVEDGPSAPGIEPGDVITASMARRFRRRTRSSISSSGASRVTWLRSPSSETARHRFEPYARRAPRDYRLDPFPLPATSPAGRSHPFP